MRSPAISFSARSNQGPDEDSSFTDYKIRIIISDGNHDDPLVRVSENIIEVSLQLLVDSLEYALRRN